MLSLSKYTVFEMKNLSGNNNSKVIAPLLMYLFERIDSSLSSLIPTVIFLDESWFELQHPIFAGNILLPLVKKKRTPLKDIEDLSEYFVS